MDGWSIEVGATHVELREEGTEATGPTADREIKLPGVPQGVEAASLQASVLPGGLKFILLPYELEWAESETRLQRIEKYKFDARIEALGGGIFLESI